MSRFPWSSLALSTAVLFLGACAEPEPEGPAETSVAAADRAVAVGVVEVTEDDVEDVVFYPADLFPLRRAVLSAEIPGVVEAMKVREGQKIPKGRELLRVDTRSLAQQVTEAEAVDRQRRLQFERAQALLERRSITQMQFLDAQTARDVAAVRLESARLELQKSKVRAPWSGTVAKLHPEIGDYVTPGSPLAELVDTSTLEVRATAPSSDVPYLKEGAPAEVEVDVFSGEILEGTIVRLGTELDPGSRTLEVIVEIPNPDGRLRPGLAARLRLARQQLRDALTVPLEAVIELGDGLGVYVVDPDDPSRAALRRVRLGPVIGADRVVVEEGLEAGDRLIVEGRLRLGPGQKIRLDDGEG